MSRVVVIGGSGHVGTYLVPRLVEAGHEVVIVDLPPLAPVVDARAIAGAIDGFVFVVEWGQTSFATATHALHETPVVNTKVIGCVLNKTDLKDLRIQSMSRGNNQYYSYNKFAAYGQG